MSVHIHDKFRRLVTQHRFEEISNQSPVLVVGAVGLRKSVTTAIQQGDVPIQKEDGSFEIIASPHTSRGIASETLNAGVFKDARSGTVYIEAAGLNEHTGLDQLLWIRWSTAMIFSLVKEVKAVLMVIDFENSFGRRSEGVRNLAMSLSETLGSSDSVLHKAIVPVFTNAFRSGRELSKKELFDIVKKTLAIEQRKLAEKQEALEKEEPETVSEARRLEYDKVVASISFLTALKKIEDRYVISNPISAGACAHQRDLVDSIIKKTPTISKKALKQFVSQRGTRSLEMCEKLANLIVSPIPEFREVETSYMDILTKRADTSEQLISHFHAHRDLTSGVHRRAWTEIRSELALEKLKQQAVCEKLLCLHKSEKQHLEGSRTLKPYRHDKITAPKESGVLSWATRKGRHFVTKLSQTTIRRLDGWAEKRYVYKGKPFANYVHSGSNYDNIYSWGDAKGGSLTLYFQSHAGHDLDVTVTVMMHEKDLPSTLSRVQYLCSQIDVLEQQKDKLDKQIMCLKAVESQDQLVDVVLRHKSELETQLQHVHDSWARPLADEFAGDKSIWTVGMAVDALAELFYVLKLIPGGVPQDAESPRTCIEDFLREYRRGRKAERDFTAKIAADESVKENVEPASSHEELSPVMSNGSKASPSTINISPSPSPGFSPSPLPSQSTSPSPTPSPGPPRSLSLSPSPVRFPFPFPYSHVRANAQSRSKSHQCRRHF